MLIPPSTSRPGPSPSRLSDAIVVRAGGGDDYVSGTPGDDVLSGGPGRDKAALLTDGDVVLGFEVVRR